jgi:hypothetical protein
MAPAGWSYQEQQIPYGNDRKKGDGKDNGKSKGGYAISFELRVASCELNTKTTGDRSLEGR